MTELSGDPQEQQLGYFCSWLAALKLPSARRAKLEWQRILHFSVLDECA
jgi:hypothetical protein